jgi:hypothetical protein
MYLVPSWLERQRTLLRPTCVSDAAICGPSLLSIYEMCTSTASDAWIAHALAAAELVRLRRSEEFAECLEHKLFGAVRLVMVSSGFCFIPPR